MSQTIKSKIIEAYQPGVTTMMDVARLVGTNYHVVRNTLIEAGVRREKPRPKPFSALHRERISRSKKGSKGPWEGKKLTQKMLYQNMAQKLRFDISWEWLFQYQDFEKLKFLNASIRAGRFDMDVSWYVVFLDRFYNEPQFNILYESWLASGKDPYKRPTLDHIHPSCKGRDNSLENLQFLSWFENRCKNDMSQEQWNDMKGRIHEYLL